MERPGPPTTIRFLPSEYDAIKNAAEQADMTVAEYVRDAVRAVRNGKVAEFQAKVNSAVSLKLAFLGLVWIISFLTVGFSAL